MCKSIPRYLRNASSAVFTKAVKRIIQASRDGGECTGIGGHLERSLVVVPITFNDRLRIHVTTESLDRSGLTSQFSHPRPLPRRAANSLAITYPPLPALSARISYLNPDSFGRTELFRDDRSIL